MIEIKTGDVPCSVYISKVPDNLSIKHSFLDQLGNLPVYSICDQGQRLFNTDYFLNPLYNRIDYNTIRRVVQRHNDALSLFLNYTKTISVENNYFWLQQYKKNDYHVWHRHCGSFSNVYYIDLPEDSSKTTFRYMGKEFQVEVKEGHILTFPSFLEHCSKPNPSDKIKTVISFNSN